MWRYFCVQWRRAVRLLPFVLCVAAVLFAALWTVRDVAVDTESGSEENSTIQIALCGDLGDSMMRMGLSLLESLDETRFSLELVEMEESDARDALRNGDIAAYVVVPDGFMEDALHGTLNPLRFVSASAAPGIISFFKEEITGVIEDMVVSCEKGVYSLGDMMRDYGAENRSAAMDDLSYEYVFLVLARSGAVDVRETGVGGAESFGDYMTSGLMALFLCLTCMPFASLLVRGDAALGQVLMCRGVSPAGQAACDFASFFCCLMLSLLPVPVIAVASGHGGLVIGAALVAFMAAGLAFMLFSACRELISGVVLEFLTVAATCFVSGCMYPIYFFPDVVQRMAPYLPTGAARQLLAGCLAGHVSAADALIVLLYGAAFAAVGCAIRCRAVLSDGAGRGADNRIRGREPDSDSRRAAAVTDGAIASARGTRDAVGVTDGAAVPELGVRGAVAATDSAAVTGRGRGRGAVWFAMMCKRLIKQPLFVALLVLVPVLTFASGRMAEEESGLLTVALAMEDGGDAVAQAVAEELRGGDSLIRFEMYGTAGDAEDAVTYGDADCAWIFPADMGARLDRFAVTRSAEDAAVTVVEREDNVALRLSREKLEGVLFRLLSPKVFLNYIRENVPEADSATDVELLEYYDGAYVDDTLFTFTGLDGQTTETSANYLTSPVRGLLAVLIALCGMASSMYYLRDMEEGVYSRVPVRELPSVEMLVQLSGAAVITAAAEIALAVTGYAQGFLTELVTGLVYCLCVASFSAFLRRLCRGVRGVGAMLAPMTVLMLVVCPVFLDAGALRQFQYLLPPTYFINAPYDLSYALYGVVFSAALLALCALWDWVWSRYGSAGDAG